MDPEKIKQLANLLRESGDKVLNDNFKLTLSGEHIRAIWLFGFVLFGPVLSQVACDIVELILWSFKWVCCREYIEF